MRMTKLNQAYWESKQAEMSLEKSSIGDFFDQKVNEYENDDAIVFSSYEKLNIAEMKWTYLDYQQKVNELAKALLGYGFKKGDHIAVWSINLPEWLILQLACAKLGIVLVTMNPALRSNESKYILEKSDAQAVFVLSHFANRNYVNEIKEFKNKLPYLKQIFTFNDYDDAETVSYNQLLMKAALVSDERLASKQSSVNAGDIFQIQFTSGTTGFPKGVMLTHYNAINNARFLFNRWKIASRDVVFSPLPLFHTAGSILMALGSISVGAAFLTQPFFNAEDAVNIMNKFKATHFGGVPTMLQGVLNVLEETDERLELTLIMSGGSPVPQVLLEKLEKRTNSTGVVLMGMTETGGVFSATAPEDPKEKRYISSGQPLPFTSVKIVDPKTRKVQPCETPGEIEVSGYSVMKGYYKMEEQSKEALDQKGWLKTGDIGFLDSEGYLNVIGRLKDMIIRGGENIYPREIEDFILTHPKISEVQVVGVPDKYYGEVAVAFIKVKEGEQLNESEVIDYCKGKISHQKIPAKIKFVDSFPLTSSGKIQKNVLRENYIKNEMNQ